MFWCFIRAGQYLAEILCWRLAVAVKRICGLVQGIHRRYWFYLAVIL